MKSKAFILTLFVIIVTANTHAQLINMNPDPNGNPWWAGGIPETTPEIQAWSDAL